MLSVALPILLLASSQRVSSLTGNIEHIANFNSQILNNSRNIIVYLPPDYASSPGKSYPVLYMQDGQNIFDGMTSFIPNMEWKADETAQRLILSGAIEPLIIVGIDNAGMDRGNEYLPTKAKLGDSEMGGRADQYGDMIVKELMPMIESKYRIKRGPESTGLLGSSFGGVVSLYLGLKRPKVFGRLGVVSPSIWWDNRYLIKMVQELPSRLNERIWLDIGTKEGYQALKDARDMKWALIDKGWTLGNDLAYMEDPGAVHNEAAWAGRMEPVLKFLWGKR
jgi:predicted alpha/beta superfamily hydrolase